MMKYQIKSSIGEAGMRHIELMFRLCCVNHHRYPAALACLAPALSQPSKIDKPRPHLHVILAFVAR